MIVDNVEQRSLDWFRLRCGSFTGSKIGDLMKSGRKKEQVFGIFLLFLTPDDGFRVNLLLLDILTKQLVIINKDGV